MDFESRKRFLINFTFISVIIVIIYLSTRFLLQYLLPFVIGIILAFLVQKPSRFLSARLHIKAGTCAAILVSISYLLSIVLFIFTVWKAGAALYDFSDRLPYTIKYASERMSELNDILHKKLSLLPEGMADAIKSFTEDSLNDLLHTISKGLSAFATKAAKGVPTFFISAVVTFAASCYIAKDLEKLIKFSKGFLRPDISKNLAAIKRILFNNIFKLLLGYVLLMFITFIELLIGFSLLRVKHAVLLAAVTAILDVLPVIGTGTVLLPWAFICLVSGNITKAVGLIILYIVITVLRNLAEPRIIGRQIGIAPLFILLFMFLGLKLAGVTGMILLPLAIIVVIDFYKIQMEEENLTAQKPDA